MIKKYGSILIVCFLCLYFLGYTSNASADNPRTLSESNTEEASGHSTDLTGELAAEDWGNWAGQKKRDEEFYYLQTHSRFQTNGKWTGANAAGVYTIRKESLGSEAGQIEKDRYSMILKKLAIVGEGKAASALEMKGFPEMSWLRDRSTGKVYMDISESATDSPDLLIKAANPLLSNGFGNLEPGRSWQAQIPISIGGTGSRRYVKAEFHCNAIGPNGLGIVSVNGDSDKFFINPLSNVSLPVKVNLKLFVVIRAKDRTALVLSTKITAVVKQPNGTNEILEVLSTAILVDTKSNKPVFNNSSLIPKELSIDALDEDQFAPIQLPKWTTVTTASLAAPLVSMATAAEVGDTNPLLATVLLIAKTAVLIDDVIEIVTFAKGFTEGIVEGKGFKESLAKGLDESWSPLTSGGGKLLEAVTGGYVSEEVGETIVSFLKILSPSPISEIKTATKVSVGIKKAVGLSKYHHIISGGKILKAAKAFDAISGILNALDIVYTWWAKDSEKPATSVYEGALYQTDTTHLDDAREVKVVVTRREALDLSRRLARNDVDVFFLADNTGSMSAEIDEVKAKAQAILDALAGNDPRFQNVNMQWGVGRFSDDQIANPGAPGYELLQPITDDKTLVENGINQWNSSWGAYAESSFWAIQQVATDGDGTPRYPPHPSVATGQATGWRDGAAKVIVVFGDEPSHQESINEKELREILEATGAKVSLIDSGDLDGGTSSTSWDGTSGFQLPGAAQEIADGTSGAYILLIDTSQMVDAIMNAVYDAITENVRTGGQLTRIDPSNIWRSRTPSSVTAETPDGGDTFEFTLRHPGQTDSTFSVDMTAGTAVPGKTYLERDSITGGTDMFGADLSSDTLVQFTPGKDFIRFLLGDGAGAEIEGYYGYRLPTTNLPSSGISIFDVSSRSVSPYDNAVYSSDELDTRLSVNWHTGKVFGIDRASPHPRSGVGVFLGTVDETNSKIEGSYMAKTSRFSASDTADMPRYLQDTARGNTNLQLYGEDGPVGVGGTFSVNWYNEAKTPSYASMLMAGFKDDDSPSYTTISDNDTWKGFAVGFIHNRSSGSLTIGTNDDSDDVQMTFKPSSGQFSSSITVNDGSDDYSLSTSDNDSVYVSPQAFGAVKQVSGTPAHIATTTYSGEGCDYLSWGFWSVDSGTSPEKSVFAHSPWIAGQLTPGSQIPTTGTATYNGSAWGQLNDAAGFTSVHGDASLAANFDVRTLAGSFSNMKRADDSAWTDISVNAGWGAANNSITGTTSAPGGLSGTVNGAFFGSAAQEVGGNWTLQGGATQAGGAFTSKK